MIRNSAHRKVGSAGVVGTRWYFETTGAQTPKLAENPTPHLKPASGQPDTRCPNWPPPHRRQVFILLGP